MSTLPLTNDPERNFQVTILDIIYNIRQLWNTIGYWAIDILDENNSVIIYGIKLVTKTELTAQYPEIRFNLRSENDSDPNRNNLDQLQLEITQKDA